MNDLEQQIRRRFLDHLDELTFFDEEPLMDFGVAALPYFVAAFEKQSHPARRARLVRIIWQFRDAAVLPTLAIALNDHAEDVWKDALDGIITIGGEQALEILNQARTALASKPAQAEKLEWIDEAATQVTEGLFGKASRQS